MNHNANGRRKRKKKKNVARSSSTAEILRQENQAKFLAKVGLLFIVLVALLFFGAVVFAWIYDRFHEQTEFAPPAVEEVPAEREVAQSKGSLSPEEKKELQDFWETTIMPILQHQVLAFNHPIQEIGDRIKYLKKTTEDRWGKRIQLHFEFGYAPDVPSLSVVAHITDGGEPFIIFFVAKIRGNYQMSIGPEGEGSLVFGNELVIGFEHEVEHLAFSVFGGEDQTYKEFVAEEAKTWHNSCRYAIGPMISLSPELVGSEMTMTYNKWVETGMQSDSPAWIGHIRLRYPFKDSPMRN